MAAVVAIGTNCPHDTHRKLSFFDGYIANRPVYNIRYNGGCVLAQFKLLLGKLKFATATPRARTQEPLHMQSLSLILHRIFVRLLHVMVEISHPRDFAVVNHPHLVCNLLRHLTRNPQSRLACTCTCCILLSIASAILTENFLVQCHPPG